MKLFKMIFPESFNKFYYAFAMIGFITLFTSSCSTSKESSLAYMDDIYFNSSTPELIAYSSNEGFDSQEEGEPPSNVPGAAYVYTPIPEPTITTPSPNNFNPYYAGNYNYDPFLYDYYPAGNAYNASYFNYGLSLFSQFSYYNPYSNGYCPPVTVTDNDFIVSKRFQWNNNNNQYTNDINKDASGSINNKRDNNSRKSTFWNSLISSEPTNSGSGDYNRSSRGTSNATRSSGSAAPSRSNSSRSAGTTRSSGSSKSSYTGKRQR